ncbi:MAG TPA: hypothetical protein VK928_05015 [Longimicrobiales bacterium]|nr:hypothetical protein [Longimicrobiales bacterium]
MQGSPLSRLASRLGGFRRSLMVGVVTGAVYGLVARMALEFEFAAFFAVITVTFLGLVPFAIGYLAVYPAESPRIWYRVFVPWLPILLVVAAASAVGWEGAICIIMSTPLLLVIASLGGVAAALHRRRRGYHAMAVAVLPFIVAPLESTIPRPERIESNVTEIVMEAPVDVVWSHVIEVPEITPAEQRPALFTRVGFPRPVSAELSREGVGGVRHARFEGNVVFTEVITDWEQHRLIGFTIDANTDEIPATTLDPHVTIGGEYFDVLTGEYRLVPLGETRTRVILTSRHRVSTTLNPYTAWWARVIMRSIQDNILEVLRDRAERDAVAVG